MDLALNDKVVMITGGSRGLGAASARLFAAEGARLALVARSIERMKTVADEITHRGLPAPLLQVADLTQPQASDEAAEAVLRELGRIDVLVCCAGASQGGVFWEIGDATWRDSYELKFMGTVRTLRAVLPIMRRQHSGRVVVVAGNTGRQPEPRMLPGATANAALLALTRGLAEEVARDGIVDQCLESRTDTHRTLDRADDLAGHAQRSKRGTGGSHLHPEHSPGPAGRTG